MEMPRGEPFHFLLVEDDPSAVRLFERSLARTRFSSSVQVVEDGEKAIQYLSGKGPFHDRRKYPLPCLIILDLHMPKKTGLEVLEWLKGHAKLSRIPVFMLTSSCSNQDIERAAELGARAYWLKPMDLKALDRIARKIVTFLKMYCDRVRSHVERGGRGMAG